MGKIFWFSKGLWLSLAFAHCLILEIFYIQYRAHLDFDPAKKEFYDS